MSVAVQKYLEENKINGTNVYAIPMEKFKSLDITQWKYNRPPNLERIPEIHSWMKQFNRMDGVLSLAYIPGDGLVCFEGNHRRLALEGLEIPVLVDILWDATHEIVTHEFKRLNKSICVPEIYLVESETSLRGEIEKSVSDFRKKFSKMESNSGRPQRPNYNRDKFTDEIMRLHKELNITIPELMTKIYNANEIYKTKDRSKLNEKITSKCENSGLWLFAWSTTINSSDL